MKFTLISCLLFVLVHTLHAQDVRLTVLDEASNLVGYAAVIDDQQSVIAYTDENGVAVFTIDCNSTYTISYFGYTDQQLVLDCQAPNTQSITLVPDIISLKTINIVGLSAADQASKPYQVSAIERQQLRRFQSQTTVEALEQNGAAYIQRSQMGGGSPILRGFEANKVLLVVDGVRMNNAIYRSGHLQNAISVDPAILNNITTLYGPGSILYGSDALGGVIHFQTLKPRFSSSNNMLMSGGAYARYASANAEQTGHLHLNIASKKLASMSSISFSDFSDLKAGKNYSDKYPDLWKRTFYVDPDTDEIILNSDPENQIFTGYNQFDLVQKLTYKIDELQYLSANVQYSTTSDIPRYDELTVVDENGIPETSEWYYGPQKRVLASIKYDKEKATRLYDRFQIQTSYQKINEDRHQRGFDQPDLISNFEEVDVYGVNFDFFKALGENKNQEISYGAEYRYNHVLSTANRENKETGLVTQDVFTRYPSDHSAMQDIGAYALYQYKKERLTAQVGGRLNYNKLNIQYSRNDFFTWPSFFYDGISRSSTSLTWLAGINYKLFENTHFRLFTGTGFRAPNVDDFGKVRVRAASNISIPNTNLSPEKTWNIEAGVQQTIYLSNDEKQKLNIGLTAFYTSISDAIIRQDFALPNGDSTFFYNGNDLEVQANINAAEGYISGVSFNMNAMITNDLTFNSSVSYQKGRSTTGDVEQPLAHIPPLYGHATLLFQKEGWSASIKSIFNGKKPLDEFAPSSSDNEDLATPEGSLAWHTWNIYGQLRLIKQLELKVGVENIFDLHYRTFSSGLSAPGRNVKIGLYSEF